MASVVEFACPHCARISRVSAQLAGKQARCPGCRKVFEIPRPSERPAPKPEPPKPEPKPESAEAEPTQPEEGTASAAPASASQAPQGVGHLLRTLPKLLLLGLVAAAVFPGLGAIPCAIYALRSPPGSPAKRWARIGLMIAAVTTLVHFTLLNAQPKPQPGQGPAAPRRIAPRRR